MKTIALLIAALAAGCFLFGYTVAWGIGRDFSDPGFMRRYAVEKVAYVGSDNGVWTYIYSNSEGACDAKDGWVDALVMAPREWPTQMCYRQERICDIVAGKVSEDRCSPVSTRTMRHMRNGRPI